MFYIIQDFMKKKDELLLQINKLLVSKNAKLIEFTYYKKIFGNVVVKIEFNNSLHEFIIDRSDIYYNFNNISQLICTNVDDKIENYDRYAKLIEIIDKNLK